MILKPKHALNATGRNVIYHSEFIVFCIETQGLRKNPYASTVSSYCGFLIAFGCIAWDGINPVCIGDPYLCVIASGCISYNNFKYAYYRPLSDPIKDRSFLEKCETVVFAVLEDGGIPTIRDYKGKSNIYGFQ